MEVIVFFLNVKQHYLFWGMSVSLLKSDVSEEPGKYVCDIPRLLFYLNMKNFSDCGPFENIP